MSVLTSSSNTSGRLLVVCTGILGILMIATLSLARAVIIPLALAVLLTFILVPVVTRVQRLGLGRVLSVFVVAALAFLLLGGVLLVILLQFRSLAHDLPVFQENLTKKIAGLRGNGSGPLLTNLQEAASAVNEAIFEPVQAPVDKSKQDPIRVEVKSSGVAWFEAISGPALALLATGGLVLVLVVFMLIKREDLRNRLIFLLGPNQLTGTTKALDDAAQRISRFLLMQLLINAGFGLLLSTGLFLIAVPYALFWGFLMGALRFIPYVGSSLGGVLLLTFSFAAFPGWAQPLLVLAYFAILEVLTAHVAEPLLFGHSAGVSPLALLVSAAFWTWLWGPVGLLLSTPLTVCFVVVGKYVSGLKFFGVLLGDEPVLDPALSYYQRLLARDKDEAMQLILAQDKTLPPEEVYDQLLVPALNSVQRDRERDELTEADEQYVIEATQEIVDGRGKRQEAVAEKQNESTEARNENSVVARIRILGCPGNTEADRLALDMLRQLLDPAVWDVEVFSTEMLSAEQVALAGEKEAPVVCIGALPPGGLARTSYLCKRLRARLPRAKIVVGRWGLRGNLEDNQEQLLAAGADHVETTLVGTRNHLKAMLPVLIHEVKESPNGSKQAPEKVSI